MDSNNSLAYSSEIAEQFQIYQDQDQLETLNPTVPAGLVHVLLDSASVNSTNSTIHTIEIIANGALDLQPNLPTQIVEIAKNVNNDVVGNDTALPQSSVSDIRQNTSTTLNPLVQTVLDYVSTTMNPILNVEEHQNSTTSLNATDEDPFWQSDLDPTSITNVSNVNTTQLVVNVTKSPGIFNLIPNTTTSTSLAIFESTTQAIIVSTSASIQNDTVSQSMSTGAMVCTVIPLSLIILLIVFGNLLVIIAVFTQRSLRTPQNIYIVSLAIADMTVGLLILPINITYMVLGRWFMGEIMCQIWLVTDVSLCTVSIFHLCAIAVDRYRAITDGINYVQKRNLRSVLHTIVFIWITAFWIGSPPILGWKDKVEDGETPIDLSVDCLLPTNVGYVFHLATGALFFPLFLMSFIYVKIFFAIQQRFRERSKVQCMELTSEHESTDGKTNTLRGPGKRKPSEQINTFMVNKQKFSLSREKKAARTLGIIMGAFIVCWLPLGFMNILTATLPKEYNPSELAFQIVNWLGYINSGLNPIIYAVSNHEFQKGFKRILHLS